MQSEIQTYLSKIQLLNTIPDHLLSYMTIKQYKSGDYICRSGESVELLHIILEGVCNVLSLSPEGKLVLVSNLYPGDFCGDIEIFGNSLYLQSVQASDDVVALIITQNDLLEIFFKDISFLQFLCRSFAGKAYLSSYHYSHTLLYPVRIRLAQYLLYESQLKSSDVLYLKVEKLAQYFGTSPRHLRRVLAEFRKLELISRSNTTETIIDVDKLKKYIFFAIK